MRLTLLCQIIKDIPRLVSSQTGINKFDVCENTNIGVKIKYAKVGLIPFLAILIIIISQGCNQTQKENRAKNATIQADTLVEYSVKSADTWTNLFYRNSGWFGADGIFSIPLDGVDTLGAAEGKTTMLIFSDTFVGEIEGDSLISEHVMVNSSVAYVTKPDPTEEDISIMYKQDGQGNPLSYFKPNTPNSKPGEYYWMGDAFVNAEADGAMHIFGYRVFDKSEASWDFEIRGVTLISIPKGEKPPFENYTQMDAPLFIKNDTTHGTFGSGIYVNTKAAGAPDPDGYIYVYGLIDPNKRIIVSRVNPASFTDFTTWRFWDGDSWVNDIKQCKPIVDRASNELSLTPLKDGRYLLTFQADGIGQHVAIRIGESPIGPFGPMQKIWKCPEVNYGPGLIPYNAKAHYSLSNPGELLISYNTISMDYFNDIKKWPHMYRPRFIKLYSDLIE